MECPGFDLSFLQHVPALEELDVSDHVDRIGGAGDYSPISHCKQLKVLIMKNTKVHNLSFAGGLVNLEYLDLSQCSQQVLTPLVNCPRLHTLKLNQLHSSRGMLGDYASIGKMTSLVRLETENLSFPVQLEVIKSKGAERVTLQHMHVLSAAYCPRRDLGPNAPSSLFDDGRDRLSAQALFFHEPCAYRAPTLHDSSYHTCEHDTHPQSFYQELNNMRLHAALAMGVTTADEISLLPAIHVHEPLGWPPGHSPLHGAGLTPIGSPSARLVAGQGAHPPAPTPPALSAAYAEQARLLAKLQQLREAYNIPGEGPGIACPPPRVLTSPPRRPALPTDDRMTRDIRQRNGNTSPGRPTRVDNRRQGRRVAQVYTPERPKLRARTPPPTCRRPPPAKEPRRRSRSASPRQGRHRSIRYQSPEAGRMHDPKPSSEPKPPPTVESPPPARPAAPMEVDPPVADVAVQPSCSDPGAEYLEVLDYSDSPLRPCSRAASSDARKSQEAAAADNVVATNVPAIEPEDAPAAAPAPPQRNAAPDVPRSPEPEPVEITYNPRHLGVQEPRVEIRYLKRPCPPSRKKAQAARPGRQEREDRRMADTIARIRAKDWSDEAKHYLLNSNRNPNLRPLPVQAPVDDGMQAPPGLLSGDELKAFLFAQAALKLNPDVPALLATSQVQQPASPPPRPIIPAPDTIAAHQHHTMPPPLIVTPQGALAASAGPDLVDLVSARQWSGGENASLDETRDLILRLMCEISTSIQGVRADIADLPAGVSTCTPAIMESCAIIRGLHQQLWIRCHCLQQHLQRSAKYAAFLVESIMKGQQDFATLGRWEEAEVVLKRLGHRRLFDPFLAVPVLPLRDESQEECMLPEAFERPVELRRCYYGQTVVMYREGGREGDPPPATVGQEPIPSVQHHLLKGMSPLLIGGSTTDAAAWETRHAPLPDTPYHRCLQVVRDQVMEPYESPPRPELEPQGDLGPSVEPTVPWMHTPPLDASCGATFQEGLRRAYSALAGEAPSFAPPYEAHVSILLALSTEISELLGATAELAALNDTESMRLLSLRGTAAFSRSTMLEGQTRHVAQNAHSLMMLHYSRRHNAWAKARRDADKARVDLNRDLQRLTDVKHRRGNNFNRRKLQSIIAVVEEVRSWRSAATPEDAVNPYKARAAMASSGECMFQSVSAQSGLSIGAIRNLGADQVAKDVVYGYPVPPDILASHNLTSSCQYVRRMRLEFSNSMEALQGDLFMLTAIMRALEATATIDSTTSSTPIVVGRGEKRHFYLKYVGDGLQGHFTRDDAVPASTVTNPIDAPPFCPAMRAALQYRADTVRGIIITAEHAAEAADHCLRVANRLCLHRPELGEPAWTAAHEEEILAIRDAAIGDFKDAHIAAINAAIPTQEACSQFLDALKDGPFKGVVVSERILERVRYWASSRPGREESFGAVFLPPFFPANGVIGNPLPSGYPLQSYTLHKAADHPEGENSRVQLPARPSLAPGEGPWCTKDPVKDLRSPLSSIPFDTPPSMTRMKEKQPENLEVPSDSPDTTPLQDVAPALTPCLADPPVMTDAAAVAIGNLSIGGSSRQELMEEFNSRRVNLHFQVRCVVDAACSLKQHFTERRTHKCMDVTMTPQQAAWEQYCQRTKDLAIQDEAAIRQHLAFVHWMLENDLEARVCLKSGQKLTAANPTGELTPAEPDYLEQRYILYILDGPAAALPTSYPRHGVDAPRPTQVGTHSLVVPADDVPVKPACTPCAPEDLPGVDKTRVLRQCPSCMLWRLPEDHTAHEGHCGGQSPNPIPPLRYPDDVVTALPDHDDAITEDDVPALVTESEDEYAAPAHLECHHNRATLGKAITEAASKAAADALVLPFPFAHPYPICAYCDLRHFPDRRNCPLTTADGLPRNHNRYRPPNQREQVECHVTPATAPARDPPQDGSTSVRESRSPRWQRSAAVKEAAAPSPTSPPPGGWSHPSHITSPARRFCAYHECYGMHSTSECSHHRKPSWGVTQHLNGRARLRSVAAHDLEGRYFAALREYKAAAALGHLTPNALGALFNEARVLYVGYMTAEDEARQAHEEACSHIRQCHLELPQDKRPMDPTLQLGRVTATSANGKRAVAQSSYLSQAYYTYVLPEGAVETDQVELAESPSSSTTGSGSFTSDHIGPPPDRVAAPAAPVALTPSPFRSRIDRSVPYRWPSP